MIRNYFISAIRNFRRNKWFSLINLIGLSVGLAACIIIIVYLNFESSFNKFHENSKSIFRVSQSIRMGDQITMAHTTHAPLGPLLVDEFPEIEYMVRFNNRPPRTFIAGDEKIRIDRIVAADSCLFKMFSFRLKSGDPGKALTEPGTLVLTETTARILFGDEDPLGLNLYTDDQTYTVSGVVEDPPENSSIRFNIIEPFQTYYENDQAPGWGVGIQYVTYVQLGEMTDHRLFEEKTKAFMDRVVNPLFGSINASLYLNLEYLEDIYLFSVTDSDPVQGSVDSIKVFSAVAFFILIIACLNYINLSTAKAFGRLKEVGIRKVAGATRKQLIFQFIGETVLMSFIALIVAIVVAETVLPFFGTVVQKTLTLTGTGNMNLLWLIPVLIFITGILAGSIQAFYISSFDPSAILKKHATGPWHGRLQNVLVFIQFSISIFLIIASVIIFSQLDYMLSKDPGYEQESILVVKLNNEESRGKWEVLKGEIRNIPGVMSVSATSYTLGVRVSFREFIPEGMPDAALINYFSADNDLIETFGLKLMGGRNFHDNLDNERNSYIVNRAFVEAFEITYPIGSPLLIPMGNNEPRRGTIIGVMDDFSYRSAHHPVDPLVYTVQEIPYNQLNIRFDKEHVTNILLDLNEVWPTIIDSEPVEYDFLDYLVRQEYKNDTNFAVLISGGTLLAIIIACLGLLALAANKTEGRRKEIGIRKAHGACTNNIVFWLVKDFTRWVLLANITAWPLAWILMKNWLAGFAFRIDIHIMIFFVSAVFSWMLAVLTIFAYARKAALENPVESLRYE
jgi:putative ABC transport system permease protein